MGRKVRLGLCTVLVVLTVGIVASGTVAAQDRWTPDPDDPHVEDANFTLDVVHQTDHYPGDVNEENASLQIVSDTGEEVAEEMGAEDGMWLDGVRIWTPFADWSACETDNTAVYGIDRGSDNEGTQYDDGLLQHRKTSWFLDDGVASEMYNWDDFASDPPYMAPEDATVFEIGARSSAGACLTMTDEPGWYRAEGYQSGIVHDPDLEGEENADNELVGGYTYSNYIYVCECDSEAEAREQLGPPPDENGEPTPTPGSADDEPTPGSADDAGTPGSETDDAEATLTPESADDATTDDAGSGEQASDDGEGLTPTPGDGPGFGPVAALLGVLAAGSLVHRLQ